MALVRGRNAFLNLIGLACIRSFTRNASEIPPDREKMKRITNEALNLVNAIKRVRGDSEKLDTLIKSRTPRMVKGDVLSVLYILQEHQEVDLAYKMFEVARKESWYTPTFGQFLEMTSMLAKHHRFEELWNVLDEMVSNGIAPNRKMMASCVQGCMEAGNCVMAMKLFRRALLELPKEQMSQGFFVSFRQLLLRAGQLELSQSVSNDLKEFRKKQQQQQQETHHYHAKDDEEWKM